MPAIGIAQLLDVAALIFAAGALIWETHAARLVAVAVILLAVAFLVAR